MSDRPEWWEPLLERVSGARRDDFTRLPVPDEGGRPSAVLILLADQDGAGPDVLLLQRAEDMRNHAGQPAFPGGAAGSGVRWQSSSPSASARPVSPRRA